MSESIWVNDFWEGFSKIRDKFEWEVTWSAVVDINGVSSLDSGEFRVFSFGDGDRCLWFVNKAKSIEGVSKSADLREIFGIFLQLEYSYSIIGFSR